MDQLLQALGDEVLDPDEESFLLFSQSVPSQNLGFVDPKASSLDFTIGGRDFSVRQSPGVLASSREGGTTGAVVWKVTPLFAAWIASPSCILRAAGILGADATAVELGTGISGLNALALSPFLRSYIATDQHYVLKLLRENLASNDAGVDVPTSTSGEDRKKPAGSKKRGGVRDTSKRTAPAVASVVTTAVLDWQTDEVTSLRPLLDATHPTVDLIIACDCVYNEALVDSFVTTCADLCSAFRPSQEKPTLCVVAQQLRSPDVFETWLAAFAQAFRVWRVPDELLDSGLRQGQGFVVHVGVLRD